GSAEAVIEAANEVGYPVAIKGVSPAVTHRAAAGLLALGIGSDREARAAHRRLTDPAGALGVELEGLYVQHMVARGLELLVSAFRDPVFGVMVSGGAGGNLTELIGDVALERAPVSEAVALDLLERLRIARHLSRLAPGAELGAAARF